MSTVLKLVQGTPAWLEHRRKYRNASETPAVIGVSPWQTPYQLWLAKTGRKETKVTPAMLRGTQLEPAARAAYERQTGLVLEPLVMVEGEYGASLDGITLEGDLILEIKCPEKGRDSQLWQRAEAKELPEVVFWQVQHQLMVTAAALAHVFVFDGQEGVVVEQAPAPASWDRIRSGWDGFMRFILSDQPPPLVPDRDTLLRTDAEWQQAAEAYVQAKRTADAASGVLEAAREQLVALASNPSESGSGVTVSRYWKQGSVDYKKIPELKGVELEKYRGPARLETRITVSS